MGPALVGRSAERAALADALAAPASGRGALVLLTGPAGMGKTALATAAADASEVPALWGGAWEGGGAPAYRPWTQILRALVRARGPAVIGDRADRLAELLPELRPGPAVTVGPSDGARYALFEAVADVLRAAAPLLVVLDDLHVAGRPSALLLQFVARELRGEPLALVATYRSVEAKLDEGVADVVAALEKDAVVLPLAGLAPDEVDELVRHAAGFAPDAGLAAAIRLRTEGNPLFVGEVARLITAGGADAEQWPVPVGIRQALRARIARCDAALLGAAAVLGRRFDVTTLARLVDADAPDVAARLDDAVAAELAVPDGPGHFRFTHDLVRETASSDLPPRERARLHTAAVVALGERAGTDPAAHLALLAHHALAAVPVLDGAVAAAHARRAGAQAMRVYAFDEAARVLDGALAALDAAATEDGALRCAVLLDLAEARVKGGDPPAARPLLARAAELARRHGDGAALARAALIATERLDFNDVDADALALLDEAAAALDGAAATDAGGAASGTGAGAAPSGARTASAAARDLARVLARLAVAGYHALPDERDAHAAAAVDAARASGDPATLAHALSAGLYVAWGRRRAEEVLPVADEIVALAERSADLEQAFDGRMWRLIARLEIGDLDAAERELRAIEQLAERLRQPLHRLIATSRRATLALLRGRVAESIDLARTAREIGERGREPDADAVYWGQVFAAGEFVDVPVADDERMERILRALVAGSPLSTAHAIGLVLHCLRTDRREEARSRYAGLVAADPAELPHDMVRTWTLTQLALACVAFDDAATAERLHAALAPLAGRFAVAAGGTACSGAVDHYLGLLDACRGRTAEAVAHLERAAAAHERAGTPALLALTRLALARVGPTARRAALHDAAAATVDALGLTRLVEVTASAPLRPVFGREGGLWAVTWRDSTARVPTAGA